MGERCVTTTPLEDEEPIVDFNLADFGDKPTGENTKGELDTTDAQREADIVKSQIEEAKKIWEEGRALDYMCSSCRSKHTGDTFIIETLILSYAATRIKNCEGIHVSISGGAGTGKSHVTTVVKDHLPESSILSGRLSDKALFYKSVPPKTVIIMDDQELSEDIQEAIKNSTTDWNTPYYYYTVKNQGSETLKLPVRAVYWVVKVNLNGDEQILDRQLLFFVDESNEQMKRIQTKIKEGFLPPPEESLSPKEKGDITTSISKFIWENVPDDVLVHIPYAKDINIGTGIDPRNTKIFFALIQAIALMRAPIRQRAWDEGILASIEDFREAARIINPLLGNKGGSQTLKLSSPALTVLDWLLTKESGTYTYGDIREGVGYSQKKLSEALNGRGDLKNGGLEQCNGIEITSINVRELPGYNDPLGTSKTTNKKVVIWNKEDYMKYGAAVGDISMKYEDQNKWANYEKECISRID